MTGQSLPPPRQKHRYHKLSRLALLLRFLAFPILLLHAFLPSNPPSPLVGRRFTTQPRAASRQTPPKNIVIIGAGVGGLVTAGRLARATRARGYNTTITIVEKNGRDCAGGRLGEYIWEGHRWETGPSLLLLPEVYQEAFEALGGSFFDFDHKEKGGDVNGASSSAGAGDDTDHLSDNKVANSSLLFTKVEPSYLVVFGDRDRLELYTNRTRMTEAIERLEPGAFPRYDAYLDSAQNNLDFGFSAFIEEKPKWRYLPAFLRNLNVNMNFFPLRSHQGQLEGLFASRKLQAAMSFQDLYVGLSPYQAPAVFSLLQAIELNQGVFYPKGGFAQVSRELLRLAEANGVRTVFDSPVAEILLEEEEEEEEERREKEIKGTDGRGNKESTHLSSLSPSSYSSSPSSPPEVGSTPRPQSQRLNFKTTGVRLSSGQCLQADLVISNVDLPFTKKYLLPLPFAQAAEHDRGRFSSSVVSFLWALNKTMDPGLKHHTTFLAAQDVGREGGATPNAGERRERGGGEEGRRGGTQGYSDPGRAAWDSLFKHNEFDSRWFNFYVHAPQRTDASVCPPGHDAIMVLVPSPILGKEGRRAGGKEEEEEEEEEEERLVATVREAVLARLEEMEGMEDMRACLIHEKVIGPREWRERYSLSRGAVFGLRHDLGQLSFLRPGWKHRGGRREGGREGGRLEGLYYCGASSRPGNGVPLVMVGARLLSERIMKECFLEREGGKERG